MKLSEEQKKNLQHLAISVFATALISLLQYAITLLGHLPQNFVTTDTSQIGAAFMAIKFWPK